MTLKVSINQQIKINNEVETTKKRLLDELKKYGELLSEHHLTLEKQKENKEVSSLLLKVIKNVGKVIVRKSSKLISLKDSEEWHDQIIKELEQEKKTWWGIENSHTITEFKKLVGVQKFNELLKY